MMAMVNCNFMFFLLSLGGKNIFFLTVKFFIIIVSQLCSWNIFHIIFNFTTMTKKQQLPIRMIKSDFLKLRIRFKCIKVAFFFFGKRKKETISPSLEKKTTIFYCYLSLDSVALEQIDSRFVGWNHFCRSFYSSVDAWNGSNILRKQSVYVIGICGSIVVILCSRKIHKQNKKKKFNLN